MFLEFFYLLRSNGIGVSVNEWMTLMEALHKGLHGSSLTGFYYLCRLILVHTEADFDKFDQTFLQFFKDVPYQGEVPEEIMNWVNRPMEDLGRDFSGLFRRGEGFDNHETLEEIMKRMEDIIRQQDAEHNGGNKWVGTQGFSAYGNSGWHPNGLRVGGKSTYRTAMDVAGERNYKDFRTDRTLDTRQFQLAFRKLRTFTTQDPSARKEVDVDGTIDDTCNNAGTLKVRYKNPRRNTIKLLMLMDAGGSMEWYANLCSQLFQAATKCNYFKELHTYYFHNCIFDCVYTTPGQFFDQSESTDWLLHNFGPEYKVILVGDAEMNPYELHHRHYNWRNGDYDGMTGMERLVQLRNHFPYLIWLNPEPMPKYENYYAQTHLEIAASIPMYDLSVDGLEKGIRSLMVRK